MSPLLLSVLVGTKEKFRHNVFIHEIINLVCLIFGLHSAADTLSVLENNNSISLTVVICQNYWHSGNVKAKIVLRSVCLCIPLLTACLPVTAPVWKCKRPVCFSKDPLVNKEFIFSTSNSGCLEFGALSFALFCPRSQIEKGQISDFMPSYSCSWGFGSCIPLAQGCPVFSWSRGIYPPSLIFPEAFAFGDGLSLLFGEAALGVGRLFAKRKPCTQGFARKTCGFHNRGV